MLNDILISTKIREGNIKVFEEMFRIYYTPLCIYASCITGQTEAAEEIVQELFYVLWRDREKLPLLHSLKSYLYSAVRKESLEYLEHEEVKQRYWNMILTNNENNDLTGNAQNETEYKELQHIIIEVVKSLPEQRNRIFRMHRFEGKKYKEIASILHISIKTVEAEISKALKAIKTKVELYYNE